MVQNMAGRNGVERKAVAIGVASRRQWRFARMSGQRRIRDGCWLVAWSRGLDAGVPHGGAA